MKMKNAQFTYVTEFSFIGTEESAICGININGRKVPFTGAVLQIERFGVTAEELAVFAGQAESIHFEREFVYIPVCGTGLNDKTFTEEIAVLTAIAVENGEPIKIAKISRVVCRW